MLNYNDLKQVFKEVEDAENEAELLRRERLELDKKRHELKIKEYERKERLSVAEYERKLERQAEAIAERERAIKRERTTTALSCIFYGAIIIIYFIFLNKIL